MLTQLRESHGAELPIIMVTAATRADVAAALQLANDHVSKLINFTVLFA